MSDQSITLYFPELSLAQLQSIESLEQHNKSGSESNLTDDWQYELAQQIGLNEELIPWNLLRASHFNLTKETRTIVCCDPVLMQMTHRGAYLWGQQGLHFSAEEVIQIIANINEKLMDEGECFYLLNNGQWLYASEHEKELNQASFEGYIGKDMFGFSYPGKDGLWWDKLATEIQMLIKQMMDYQGLSNLSPEHLLSIHFWGNTNSRLDSLTSIQQSTGNWIVSNDNQLKSLANFCRLPFYTLEALQELENFSTLDNSHLSIILSNSQGLPLQAILTQFFALANHFEFDLVRIVTADQQIVFNQHKNLWQKLTQYFRRP